MFDAESVDSDNFFLIFFSILLADGIAIEQFIVNVVRIVSFLALLLPLYRLLHHPHDDLLQVILSHQVSSDRVAIVVVVVLLEKQQFFLGGEGRLDELDDISKGEVDCNIEIAEPEEISIFGNGNLTIIDPFDELKDLLLLLIFFQFRQHVFGNEAVHF